jgi:hypothetical protein
MESTVVREYPEVKFSDDYSDCIPPSIYWGGCAFGAAFYVGVHRAMVEKWGLDFYKKVHHSGGSAGTIFAIGLALGFTPDELDRVYREVAEKCHKRGAVHWGSVFMEEALRIMLSDPMAYKKLEGRCCFGTTEFFSRHRWHVSWVDNEDVIKCVNASLHVPLYCQRNVGIKGIKVVDGAYGFAGEDLPHGDDTLYVGIDPHAEITRTFTYPEMMFPAIGKEYDDMVDSGYQAFMKWDGKMKKKLGHRTPNYQALYVLWLLKFVEEITYGVCGVFHYLFILLLSIFSLKSFMIQMSKQRIMIE